MTVAPEWLRSRWLPLALCGLAMLPLLVPHYIAILDFAAHMGRYALQLDDGRSADLARWYSYQWHFIPNLGVDMLMLVLGPNLPFFTAVKVAMLAIPVAHVLGVTYTSRAVHGYVTPPAILAVPVVFGFFFGFGFANFCLGVGVAFCAFALWRSMGDRGRFGQRALLFVGVSSLVWLVHMTGWGLLCILCGADELVRSRGRLPGLARAALRLLVLLAPFAIKIVLTERGEAAGPAGVAGMGAIGDFFDWEAKAANFAFILRDRWMLWDLGGMLLLIGFYIWASRSRQFAFDPALLLATVILAMLYILMPSEMGGSLYTDTRLSPMLYVTALLSLRPTAAMSRRGVAMLALAALLFTGARIAGNAVSLALWDRQFAKDLATLDAVPPGTTMITLTAMPCGRDIPWNRDRRAHLSGLAIPLRHLFDNNQFASVSGQLIRAHNPQAGIFQSSPSGEARAHDCAPGDGMGWQHKLPHVPAGVRYLWRVGLDRHVPVPGWTLIRDTGTVQLYRR